MVGSSGVQPLDTALVQRFWKRGWLVVEGVFGPRAADSISKLALSVGDTKIANTADIDHVVDTSVNGLRAPRKLIEPFREDREFRKFVLSPRLSAIVAQLIGKPALLATDQIFMKPPRFGSAKPYHQDNAYFSCQPADDVVTAWIALDDVDESNGCLRYIDGSHRDPPLEHVPIPGEPHNKSPRPEQIDLSRESIAPVGKGGVVFHHSNTLHTSHRNESDRWRRGYATHWVSGDVTSSEGFIDRAYFVTSPGAYEEALAAAQNSIFNSQ